MMGAKKASTPSTKEMSEHKKIIKIEAQIALQMLAQRMSLKATEVLMKLLSMGMPGVNINSTLDADTAKLVASEFGWEVEDVAISDEAALDMARGKEDENEADMLPRPPIVTVMGHVDHGKTSLLDQIRRTNVAASEAGGITQHIGAYKVNTSRGPITFLDTPGHAAFTQMRMRGAQVTDIVVLVVAADDGVMPQTREAVAHARAAGVPLIVAVNKIDKEGADPDRIRRELSELNLIAEDWGGDTIFCEVSAKTREGIEALLEMTALQAELLELRANPKKPAVGNVIEALLDRGKGPVARVVVTDGTLSTGDVILAGTSWGKVRAMTDDRGRMVRHALPSQPVEILGLSEVPSAGDPIHVIKDVKIAQELAQQRRTKVSGSFIPASAKVSLEDIAKRMAEADQLELRLIIKADVQGSVEAVADALAKLSTDKVRVAIIHAAVGGITEGDVNLAVASKAIIVGFSVRPAGKAAQLAESEGIEIRLYTVIYDAVDDVKKAMLGLIGPTFVQKQLGKAEVRQTFHIAKIGTVAGCIVQDGTMRRNAKVRLIRDSIHVWEGKFASLKRFKDDAREVDKGFECGISLDGFNDVKVGDVLECFEQAEVQPTL
jgi:translation initiation factor IF-2